MTALADKFEFRVRWEPFLLRPNTPLEGTPKSANFADPQNPGVRHLKQAGQEVGIDFTYKAPVVPNTLKAHALLELARNKGQESLQNDVAERLFDAYFTKGKFLDDDVLMGVGKEAGLDPGEVKAYINTDKVIQDIRTKALSWAMKGVSGVPYFYMNGRRMFSGAQDVETFKKMIEMVAEEFSQEATSRT